MGKPPSHCLDDQGDDGILLLREPCSDERMCHVDVHAIPVRQRRHSTCERDASSVAVACWTTPFAVNLTSFPVVNQLVIVPSIPAFADYDCRSGETADAAEGRPKVLPKCAHPSHCETNVDVALRRRSLANVK